MLKIQTAKRSQNLIEHVVSAPSGRIDRAGGFIRGVKILGATSKNGRDYSPQAMKEAAALYEGCAVNLNHPGRSNPGENRRLEEGIGWLENIKVRPDGVYGDLAVIKSHPQANAVFEAAERNPSRFGLSHNAEGQVETRNGRTMVESVTRVRSVDLVQNPATNTSLFESVDTMPDRRIVKSERELLIEVAKLKRQLLESRPPVNGKHMALRYGNNRRGCMRSIHEADGELIKQESTATGLTVKPVDAMSTEELRDYIKMLQGILDGRATSEATPKDPMSPGWVGSPSSMAESRHSWR